MVEERGDRQVLALAIHDDIVQGLATAKLSLELGDMAMAMAVVADTLVAARRIVSDLHEGMDAATASHALRRPSA